MGVDVVPGEEEEAESPRFSGHGLPLSTTSRQVSISESKAKKALLGASSFLLVFNCLAVPFAMPKLRRFLGAPYVPMKRRAVEASRRTCRLLAAVGSSRWSAACTWTPSWSCSRRLSWPLRALAPGTTSSKSLEKP